MEGKVKTVGAFCLVIGSLVLLGYSLKRTDYLLAVGMIVGFVPFALGLFYLLSVSGFFPSP
jgi:hypothetical protein